jgi:hypothetical protein
MWIYIWYASSHYSNVNNVFVLSWMIPSHILIEQKEEQMLNLDDSLALNDAIEQIPYFTAIWPHTFPTKYELSC